MYCIYICLSHSKKVLGYFTVNKFKNELKLGIIFIAGFAALSNVEFRRMGQFGWTDPSDPRYALAISGINNDDGSTYVKKCSFNNGYSFGIGAFDSTNITFENNVIHRTVGAGRTMFSKFHCLKSSKKFT